MYLRFSLILQYTYGIQRFMFTPELTYLLEMNMKFMTRLYYNIWIQAASVPPVIRVYLSFDKAKHIMGHNQQSMSINFSL